MALPRSSRLQLALLLTCALVSHARASDPDPLTDFAPNVTDFTFRGLGTNGVVTVSDGGKRAALNTTIFPALQALGITYVRFEMAPCGENEPHTHPRASEILTLVSGGPLQVGFVDTKSVPHIEVLYPGDVQVFPRGMLHFEINVGNTTALYFSALNSQNPGTLSAANALAQVPRRALIGALKTGSSEADQFKAAQPSAGGESTLIKLDPSVCQPATDISAVD